MDIRWTESIITAERTIEFLRTERLVSKSAAGTMSYYLAIVGTHDNPMYESYFTSTVKTSSSTIMSVPLPSVSTSFSIFGGLPTTPSLGGGAAATSQVGYGHKNGQGGKHVMQLVAHASLDVIEDVQWSHPGM